ncbi:MAG: MFS transporter [Chloroflexi bacterium]|nr:MFS transporter [Chloroflexota bacterium]
MNSNSGAVPASPPAVQASTSSPDGSNRPFVVGVISTSHFLNHVQSGIGGVLLPVMMSQMGFSYFELGLISSVRELCASGMQVVYGVLAQYCRRSVLLGITNNVLGLSAMVTGLTQSFEQVLGARAISGVGSSAQNPVGSVILVTIFRKSKGNVLGLHRTAGNVGSLAAPLLAVGLLLYFDWRVIWMIVGIASMIMGFVYFFFRDTMPRSDRVRAVGPRISLSSYAACLKNREVLVVSAIQMVGASGRSAGIDVTYFVPFFMAALDVDVTEAGLLLALLQLGGAVGPICLGWLSDRVNRRLVVSAVLLLSTITTLTLVVHSLVTPALVLNLLAYGAVVNARGSLTQAMLADAVPEEHTDAAFSLYFFIGFISGPLWTALMGFIVDSRGFTTAFLVISLTYLMGIALLALIKAQRRPRDMLSV